MKLKRLYIEITNVCNLHCSFCSPSVRAPRQMNEAEFAHILQEVAPFAPHLYLHVKGEPLLHPKLGAFLQMAQNAGLPVNVTTNGTLLQENAALLLQSAAVRQVNLSVHSLENTPPEAQQRYLKTLAAFGLAATQQGAPYVSYRMWNGATQQGISEAALAQLQVLAQPFGCTLNAALPKGRNAAKLSPNVYVSFAEQFTWPSLALPEICTQGKCLGAREMLAILADGTLVPCCLDADGSAALGNIFTQSLQEMMDTARFKALQKGFSGAQGSTISEDLCRRCTYRTRFDTPVPGR